MNKKARCLACNGVNDVQEGMCADCFETMPMDEWVSVKQLQLISETRKTK